MTNKQLDKALLCDLKNIMGDEFTNLINVFIADSEKRLSLLSTALLVDHDTEEVRKLAHGLKGSSANMAAENLQMACQKMEAIGKELTLAEAKELLPTIESIYQEVKQELLVFRDGLE